MTKQQIEKRIAELEASRAKAEAQLNVIAGAIQALKWAISEGEEKPVGEPANNE